MTADRHLTLTNWGAYEIETDGENITAVHPFAKDPEPSAIGQSLTAVRESRVMRPSVRESWYRHGPGANPEGRGREPFVEVEWNEVLDLLAGELERVRTDHGNRAIFGGSYGWASAGRFHHAQSQLHRFLAAIGGYTDKVDTYSHAAGEVIVPHVLGMSLDRMHVSQPSFAEIAEHAELVVSFGGMAVKNSQVHFGGQGRHMMLQRLETCRDRGVRFVNLSPLRDDMATTVDAEWIPTRPGTDTAVMLGLAHTLLSTGSHDEAFLTTRCVGWERLRSYLLGETDGVVKDAGWAAGISGVPAEAIRSLAGEMARSRTLVTASWSVQRSDHGEQTFWMAAALAAMLGQIGLPGAGVGFGYGAVGLIGNGVDFHRLPRFPALPNPVSDFIPVARISDLLLSPGEEFDYDGRRLTYPDIHLVYWAGGNPFHHHQDLNRLADAWRRPETTVCHEPFWNSLARHCDIVLPATTPLERNDIGGASQDEFLFWMDQVIEPVGEARDDYWIFSELAARLGDRDVFTEGRTAEQWIEHIYGTFREQHPHFPPLDELRRSGFYEIPIDRVATGRSPLAAFRHDPEGSPLGTPSGRVELYSDEIASFGYSDCPGHPTWMEPTEWLGDAGEGRLHLISNQPKTRLHSQWDHGETSLQGKVDGRERLRIHPDDAHGRGIGTGDVVRVFNERGACLAAAWVTDEVMPGVVVLPTGAWWDPDQEGGFCRAGNPNAVTRDVGTSSLAQGPTAQTCLVEVERFPGTAPEVRSHTTPTLVEPV